MKKDTTDTNDNSREEHAADLCEVVMMKECKESAFERRSRRTSELERMITLQKRLVLRMLNGDEEEFLPPQPKKPHLRIVK